MHHEAWRAAIEAWLLVLRVAGRPETTLGLRGYQLGRIAGDLAHLSPWAVTGDDLVLWLAGQRWGAETRRSFRSALRSFYGWAAGAGYVEHDPSLALPAVKPKQPTPRPTPAPAYLAALERAEGRTRLMVRLALDMGLRRGEVARVHSDDLERDLTGWTLHVHGKGNRDRRVPMPDDLAELVRQRAGAGWLFPGSDGGHLSPRWVGKLVAAVLPGAWSMHSLRHRFATDAYAVDTDLLAVQELLGHASPVTTRAYVQAPREALRRTVAAVAANRAPAA